MNYFKKVLILDDTNKHIDMYKESMYAHIILLKLEDNNYSILKNTYESFFSGCHTIEELLNCEDRKFKELVAKQFIEDGIITEKEAFIELL